MLDFTEEPVEEQKEENTEVEIKEEPAPKKKSKKSLDKAEKN